MFNVVSVGDDRHQLETADGTVAATVHNGVVRLGAFRSDEEIIAAATALWPAFDATLQRQYTGWPMYRPRANALRLVHDGAWEWVSDGRRPLARVVRPSALSDDDVSRLEFVLPSYATEGVVIVAAVSLARALERFTRQQRGTTWNGAGTEHVGDPRPA